MAKTVLGQRLWILFKNSKTKTSKTKTHKNIEQRSNLTAPILSQRNKREQWGFMKKQIGGKNGPGTEAIWILFKNSKTKTWKTKTWKTKTWKTKTSKTKTSKTKTHKNIEQRSNLTPPDSGLHTRLASCNLTHPPFHPSVINEASAQGVSGKRL